MRPDIYTAIEQARRESSMHRQGRGWIVTTYSHHYGAWESGREQTYASARQALADWRVARAAELVLEAEEDDTYIDIDAAVCRYSRGRLVGRVKAVLEYM